AIELTTTSAEKTDRRRTQPEWLSDDRADWNTCNAPVSLQEPVQALASATSDRAGNRTGPPGAVYGSASEAIRSFTSLHCSFGNPSLASANTFDRSSWVSM